jgi:hypothetical protein
LGEVEGAALEDDWLPVELDPDELDGAPVLCVAPPEVVVEPVGVPDVVGAVVDPPVVVAAVVAPPVVLGVVAVPPAAVAEVVADCEVVESQVTESGRLVTPFVLHKALANTTASFWSSSLHLAARQHAIPLRKSLLEQIQVMSNLRTISGTVYERERGTCWLHPAIIVPEPVEKFVRQEVCWKSVSRCLVQQLSCPARGRGRCGGREAYGATWQRRQLGNGHTGQASNESKSGSLHI